MSKHACVVPNEWSKYYSQDVLEVIIKKDMYCDSITVAKKGAGQKDVSEPQRILRSLYVLQRLPKTYIYVHHGSSTSLLGTTRIASFFMEQLAGRTIQGNVSSVSQPWNNRRYRYPRRKCYCVLAIPWPAFLDE
ncbi:hypothetical protein GFV_13g0100 [Bracoviriform facetosae]|uniref:Uncharacterized protein n=1 Tax=Bracoviriform facetosae TaxID=2083300 RepID=B8PQ70_9VIRU|nr:hypothetical protein GFV_13g0100 [Bracoviriform facetosae]ACE75496.1 hypothetical protein GFV_13g0100 [Bracoviriform facetosae]